MSVRLPIVTAIPEGTIILDGNGDPLDESRTFFNRWQRSIRNHITVNRVAMRWGKTCGGYPYCRPHAYVTIRYGTSTRHSQFVADWIKDGVYGFNQLIPEDCGMQFYVPGGSECEREYRRQVLEKLEAKKP